MSLRTQIATLLVALSIALVATSYAVQEFVVLPAFEELEQQGAVRDVARCVDAIGREVEGVSLLARDWATWDDTYDYVKNHNAEYVTSNLNDESFATSHVNLICFVDGLKRIVWGESRDMESLELLDVSDLFAKIQRESSPITTHEDLDDGKAGIVLTQQGPILIGSRPIITSKKTGPIRGSVIMGRFLNAEQIANLAERTHTTLDIWTVCQSDLPLEAQEAFATCLQTGETVIDVVDQQTLHAYTIVNDMYDNPALLLRVHLPREITSQGNVSAKVATAFSVGGGISTLITMWCLLKWRIVGPLQAMANHAVRVGQEDDLKARLEFNRKDEIGTLAGEFDSMVESLAESRKKVLDVAHCAGMSEIASEVLHNVGNAVNSANCSVEVLEEQLSGSKVSGLELRRQPASRAGPSGRGIFRARPAWSQVNRLPGQLESGAAARTHQEPHGSGTSAGYRAAHSRRDLCAADVCGPLQLPPGSGPVGPDRGMPAIEPRIRAGCRGACGGRSAAAPGTANEQEQDEPSVGELDPQCDSIDAEPTLGSPGAEDFCPRRRGGWHCHRGRRYGPRI